MWNVIGAALTVALAILVVEEAASDFQALVFLVALIGYQRLVSLISGEHEANRIRYLRSETWFHRIDATVRGVPPGSAGAAALVASVSDDRELEELRDIVRRSSAGQQISRWVSAATELLLLAAAASVLLR
jgi:hypothetical protein